MNRMRNIGVGLLSAGILVAMAAGPAVGQVKPRLADVKMLQATKEYYAYVPDRTSREPAVLVVIRRNEPAFARHLMQAWVDAADRHNVCLIAPLDVTGTPEEQSQKINSAITSWQRANRRGVKSKVLLGFSMSTADAIESAITMPGQFDGLILAPPWEIPSEFKPDLNKLKGMPVLLLWSKKGGRDRDKAAAVLEELQKAGCLVSKHIVNFGDNRQTTYWNGDAIFAWAGGIGEAMEMMRRTKPQMISPDE